jgi:DNA repair exonuclease SbcCD ATPase subunit
MMVDAITRIESAIERLTDISSDLKSMIAVQETRISQHEKQAEAVEIKLEKRREELDTKLKDVYDTIRRQDQAILIEIKAIREEHNKHYECLNEKFNTIQKFIWMSIGGGVALGYGFSFIANYFKVLGH